MGSFGEISGMRDVLWACFWCALHGFGGSETCWGHAFGVLGGPWGSLGSLGVLRVSLGRSLGVLGGPGSVLGSSWGAFGVILEV